MSRKLISKALEVISGGALNDWLPAPIAAEVIQVVQEINLMRGLVRSFTMNSRTVKRPKKTSTLAAYYIPDGTTATPSEFTASSVTWDAKKLMGYTMLDEEALEDLETLPDVVSQVLSDFGIAIGIGEEQVMLTGDTTHLATAQTPQAATTLNWYVHDARLMFTGIFTAAGDTGAATSVDAGGGAFDLELINQAIYNLGVYGRIKSDLICLVPSEQATNIRANSDFHDASAAGIAMASYLTGLGSAGEGSGTARGLVTPIYGIPVYEAPRATSGEAVVYYKSSPLLGDRRRIKFKSAEVIESDQRKYVVSERIALNYEYDDALCLIDDLSTDIVS